jgi:hypothetical protein
MPSPDIAQNLCEAMKACAGAPAAPHPLWYDYLRDFQVVAGALLAAITALIAYAAVSLTYRASIKKITSEERTARTANKIALQKLDADHAASRSMIEVQLKKIASDERAVTREWERRKLVSYLRLRAQMQRLRHVADLNARKLESAIRAADPPDDPRHDGQVTTIVWDYDRINDKEFGELENAWENIDLFPAPAIDLIDKIRSHRTELAEYVEDLVAKNLKQIEGEQQREGQIAARIAQGCRDRCGLLAGELKDLINVLDEAIENTQQKLKRPE